MQDILCVVFRCSLLIIAKTDDVARFIPMVYFFLFFLFSLRTVKLACMKLRITAGGLRQDDRHFVTRLLLCI